MAGDGLCRGFRHPRNDRLSRRFLDRMSDRQFYHWTRRVILVIGFAVYIGQGIWMVVTR